jgi:hypothetical protein
VSRHLLLLPALLASLALPVAPALAGEDGDSGSATLHATSQACEAGHQAKAWVSGDNIENVAFYVDGKRVKVDFVENAAGRYPLSMSCSRLSVGAHVARAVVTFTEGSSASSKTLHFQITRARQASARFTG